MVPDIWGTVVQDPYPKIRAPKHYLPHVTAPTDLEGDFVLLRKACRKRDAPLSRVQGLQGLEAPKLDFSQRFPPTLEVGPVVRRV